MICPDWSFQIGLEDVLTEESVDDEFGHFTVHINFV